EGQSACYLMLGSFGMRAGRDTYPRFLEAHERAVALLGLTPELRCNQAHALHLYECRLDEAEAGLRQALAEKPALAIGYLPLEPVQGTRGGSRTRLDTNRRA